MKTHFGTSDPELFVAFAELAGKSTACQRPGEERIKMFTLWFLAKTHQHDACFMFQVAVY